MPAFTTALPCGNYRSEADQEPKLLLRHLRFRSVELFSRQLHAWPSPDARRLPATPKRKASQKTGLCGRTGLLRWTNQHSFSPPVAKAAGPASDGNAGPDRRRHSLVGAGRNSERRCCIVSKDARSILGRFLESFVFRALRCGRRSSSGRAATWPTSLQLTFQRAPRGGCFNAVLKNIEID